jgi:hypothetical protein
MAETKNQLNDWTVGKENTTNSSDEFLFLTEQVERIIRQSASALINGSVYNVAKTIMAQLARCGMMKPQVDLETMKDLFGKK